ncbi:chemotaxis protein CheX [Oceanobacillus chungangensis]|uniref:Chemotaxis protein CheX n=1 Tax=Oceanobacillus chungangensis TaxID=1229152 RepID=A0A3D8PGY5_9BACI|nr:chemotaxis protein CheX [Oceanobacillus chungangensis]RDW15343.1 chemotaxis protein CheX [Oceanobacillus chungangensis]
MTIEINERNRTITDLLNATYTSLKSIVPNNYQMSKPHLIGKHLKIKFGLLIGLSRDIKGSLILSADKVVFSSISHVWYAIRRRNPSSFSGELGNMLAGRISTTIIENGIQTDITAPTILQGNTTLSGYERAIHMTAVFDNIGEMDICLLLN